MQRLILLGIVSFLVASSAARSQEESALPTGPEYSVAVYDTTANPAEDLEATIGPAQESGRRILLEIGGEWCSWCHRLDKYVHENQDVADALRAGFIIMKVNFSEENRNESFLSGYPEIQGYPHLFVLESDGTLLHSQNTGDLEEGKSYGHDKMMAFIERWSPAR